MTKGEIKNERSRGAQGKRAGFVSQAIAAALDAGVILGLYSLLLVAYGFVRFLVTSKSYTVPQPGEWNTMLIYVLGVFVLWSAWSGSGRAPGMAVLGLRVVTADGDRLSSKRAFWRAVIVVPTLGLGIVTVLFSRRNKSLYDMICRSSVVYAWRPAWPETRPNR